MPGDMQVPDQPPDNIGIVPDPGGVGPPNPLPGEEPVVPLDPGLLIDEPQDPVTDLGQGGLAGVANCSLEVLDDLGSPVVNNSYITFDLNKQMQMPAIERVVELTGDSDDWNEDSSTAKRVFGVPWTCRKAWVDWCLGYTDTALVPITGVLGGGQQVVQPVMLRTIPSQHPEFPWLYASSCKRVKASEGGVIYQRKDLPVIAYAEKDFRFQGLANVPQNLAVDGWAFYEVTYTDPKYFVLTDDQVIAQSAGPIQGEIGRYVQRTYNYSVKSLAMPADAVPNLKFYNNPNNPLPAYLVDRTGIGLSIGVGPYLLRPMIQFEFRWVDVPFPPFNAITACVGAVNAALFGQTVDYSSTTNGEQGTMLCQPPKLRSYRDRRGQFMWEVIYRMDYDPQGWNNFPAKNGIRYMATFGGVAPLINPMFAGGQNTLYPYADFNKLFMME